METSSPVSNQLLQQIAARWILGKVKVCRVLFLYFIKKSWMFKIITPYWLSIISYQTRVCRITVYSIAHFRNLFELDEVIIFVEQKFHSSIAKWVKMKFWKYHVSESHSSLGWCTTVDWIALFRVRSCGQTTFSVTHWLPVSRCNVSMKSSQVTAWKKKWKW